MSTELLFVGDVHVSDKPPSTRTSSYREDILKKLIEIGMMAKGKDAVVFVGDIFHSKRPRNTSHQTVRAVAQILQSYPAPVYIVPGNHDYAARNLESLSRHPLGTVALMSNVILFGTDEQRRVIVGSTEGRPLVLHGVREEEGMEAFDLTKTLVKGIDVIVVAHSAIFPPGQAPAVWEAYDARAIKGQYELTGFPALTWYGHIHEPHGVYEVDGDTTFVNMGAISRGSLHEEGALERTPAVGHVSIRADGSWEINQRFLKSARPAEEVFRVEAVTQERSEAADTNAFAEALTSANIEVFSVETAIAALLEHPDVEQAVRDRAIELVREVTG